MASKEDYQLMRVDLNVTHFLQLIDADNTKASIQYIKHKPLGMPASLDFSSN